MGFMDWLGLTSDQSSVSESISRTINDTLSKTVQSNSTNCAQNNSQVQQIDIKNIDIRGGSLNLSNISQKSVAAPNMSCIAESANTADLANKFKQDLKQNSKSSTSGFAVLTNSSSSSKTTDELINKVTNIVQQDNLFKCVQNNVQNQIMNTDGIIIRLPEYCNVGCRQGYNCDPTKCGPVNISDINQYIISDATSNCVSNNGQIQQAINDAVSNKNQENNSDTEGIFGKSMVKYIAIVAVIIGVISIIGGIILAILKSKKVPSSVPSSETIKTLVGSTKVGGLYNKSSISYFTF
jgi:hypothetical protein